MLKDSATQDSFAMILQQFFLCLRMAYIERFVLLLLLSVASTHDSKFAMDVRNTCYLFGASSHTLTEQPCLLHTESIPKPSRSNTTPPQNPAIPIILITFYEYHWHVMSHAFFLIFFWCKDLKCVFSTACLCLPHVFYLRQCPLVGLIPGRWLCWIWSWYTIVSLPRATWVRIQNRARTFSGKTRGERLLTVFTV